MSPESRQALSQQPRSKECYRCGKTFFQKPHQGENKSRFEGRRFCSRECCGFQNAGRVSPKKLPRGHKECHVCHKLFGYELKAYLLKTRVFCSRGCARRRKAVGPDGTFIGQAGYKLIPNPPGGIKFQHREIGARVLGRAMRRNEVIHHINGDKSDNSPSNLLICTLQYHSWLHAAMRRREKARA